MLVMGRTHGDLTWFVSGRCPVISDARDGEHTATRHGSCLVGVPSSVMLVMGNTRRPDSRLVSGRRPVISDARDGEHTAT